MAAATGELLGDRTIEVGRRGFAAVEEVVDQGRAAPRTAEQKARVRIARDELRHLRELSSTIDALEAEIAQLVEAIDSTTSSSSL